MNELRWGATRLPCAWPLLMPATPLAPPCCWAAPRRGHAARYSDIEIGVFWHPPPSDEECASVIAPARVNLICRYPYDAQEEVGSDDVPVERVVADQPQSGVVLEVGHYKKGPVSALCLRITYGDSL